MKSGKLAQYIGMAALTLGMSACVTKPIKTRTLSSEAGSVKGCSGNADPGKCADLVYYLPKTLLKVGYTETKGKGEVTLSPVTIADRTAGIAVVRPRYLSGRGQVTLKTQQGGDKGKSTSVGLLSEVKLTSTDETYEGQKLSELTEELLEKVNGGDKPAPSESGEQNVVFSGDADISGFRLVQETAEEKTISREILCGVNDAGKFDNHSVTGGLSVASNTTIPCRIETKKMIAQIEPLALAGSQWAGTKADVSCAERDSICYRQRMSVPFKVCVMPKKSPEAKKKEVSAYTVGWDDKTPDIASCEGGEQTVQFIEVFDVSTNYDVALTGQRFVTVSTTMTFENGTLIGFEDNRPGVIKSVAQAPFKLGTDIVNSVTILLGSVFVQ